MVGDDQVPVRVVEERTDRVATRVREVAAREDCGEDQRREHDENEGRQQPPRAPQPEAAQVDAVAGLPFDQQQRCDQVAAEHEEEVDAEEAAGHPVDAGVVDEDADDRERAEAVEPRAVADVRCVGDWSRHFRQAA